MVLASPSPSSIEKGEREHDDAMGETMTTVHTNDSPSHSVTRWQCRSVIRSICAFRSLSLRIIEGESPIMAS